MGRDRFVNRGDIYRVRPPKTSGHEQQGARYAVIVQSDDLLRLSTVVVAPTSRSARAATFRPTIGIRGESTRVLVDQMTAIDVRRLGTRFGRLDVEDLWSLDDAVRTVLAV